MPGMAKEGKIKELDSALEREKQDRADAEERAKRANERARQADEAYRKLQLDLVTAKDEAAAAKDEAAAAKDEAAAAKDEAAAAKDEAAAAKDEASAARDDAKRIEQKLTALEAEVAKLREAAEAAAAAPTPASAAPPMEPSVAPPKASAPPGPAAPSHEVIAQVEHMLQRIDGLREMLATASIELSHLHADEVALGKKRSRVLTDACALLARAVGATGQAPPPIPSPALEARFSIAPVIDISEVADLIESLRPPRAPKVD
jgi:chromosome segregation ATPase